MSKFDYLFKMKKPFQNIFTATVILFLTYTSVQAQIDASLLVNIHNVSDAEMNAIINPLTGSLVYNTDLESVMQFNGATWDRLYEAGVQILPKTTDYTVIAQDNGKIFTFDSAVDVTITIPAGLPVGFNISIYQISDGRVTISGDGGVEIKNRLNRFRTAGKDAGVGLVCTATNIFHLTGDLKQ